jgi:phenylalanyl-tRNA synthetase beta chain
MAIVVDSHITHRQAKDIICGFPFVDSVALFDVYSGEQVLPGKKSLAYHLTFQPTTKTLTDEAVDSIFKQILGKLENELGAKLRG